MKEIMDSVTYRSEEGENCLTLVKETPQKVKMKKKNRRTAEYRTAECRRKKIIINPQIFNFDGLVKSL